MGDQKDHVTIQKKDVETPSAKVETQNFETATESISPPALQLKAEEAPEMDGGEKESSEKGAYQFSLAAPPETPGENASKQMGGDTIQGKGIAEPFKMPTIQKKPVDSGGSREPQKSSFKL